MKLTEEFLNDYSPSFEMIADENIRNFVHEALITHGNRTKFKMANRAAIMIRDRFVSRGYIKPEGQQMFVDVVIAAAFLHNLFFKNGDLKTLFQARIELMPLEEKYKLNANYIFQCIEAQIGELHPIEKLKPVPHTPESELADVLFYAYNLEMWKHI